MYFVAVVQYDPVVAATTEFDPPSMAALLDDTLNPTIIITTRATATRDVATTFFRVLEAKV